MEVFFRLLIYFIGQALLFMFAVWLISPIEREGSNQEE